MRLIKNAGLVSQNAISSSATLISYSFLWIHFLFNLYRVVFYSVELSQGCQFIHLVVQELASHKPKIKNLLPSSSSTLSLYHLVSTFIGILLTFSPMHFLGFNVMARRIPDFPDSFHSWNFLSSIGSGITFLSFAVFLHIDPHWIKERVKSSISIFSILYY